MNTVTDRPWSQYFCCMVTASREFVRTSPVATKRVLRALLKAANNLRDRAGAGRVELATGNGGNRTRRRRSASTRSASTRWGSSRGVIIRARAARLSAVGAFRPVPTQEETPMAWTCISPGLIGGNTRFHTDLEPE